MDKRFKIFIVAAIVILLGMGTVTMLRTSSGNTAYINTEEVYNSFDLKKKLEADLKKTQEARQLMLDSLRYQVELLSMEVQKPERQKDSMLLSRFTSLRESYFHQQEEFEEANSVLAEEYTAQIWTQLNEYIKDYGTEEGYRYIFGANGDGSLMYAEDAVNITEEVTGYVNQHYNGAQ